MKKHILTKILFALCLVSVVSCEDEADPKVSVGGFALRSTAVAPVVLTPATDNDELVTFNWDKSDNGVSSVSVYQIQIAESGTNFAGVVTGNNGNNISAAARTYVLKGKELNELINRLPGYRCGQEMSIDVRIKSTLGQGFYNEFVQYSSNVITMRVTPYSSAKRVMALVAAGQDPNTNGRILSSDNLTSNNYEGYLYLEPGNYQFYNADDCGDFSSATVYGLSSGTLVAGGTGTFNVATAGHYFVKVNLTTAANTTTGIGAMSYAISPFTSFGIFGTARGVPFAQNVPMVYDSSIKKWTLTFDLFKGRKFKFRAVNGTTGVSVLGAASGNSLVEFPLSSTAGDIRVPGTDDGSKQNYTILLDTNNPRNYTYELIAN